MPGPDATDESRAEALARLDAVERELGALEEAVRAAAGRLHGEVARVRAAVHDLHAAAAGGPAATPAGDVADPQEDEGGRLVALDLVLRGVPDDEALRELAASFPGADAARLLADAAASLGR